MVRANREKSGEIQDNVFVMHSSTRHSLPVGEAYHSREIHTTEEDVDYGEEEEEFDGNPFDQLDQQHSRTPRITTNKE